MDKHGDAPGHHRVASTESKCVATMTKSVMQVMSLTRSSVLDPRLRMLSELAGKIYATGFPTFG